MLLAAASWRNAWRIWSAPSHRQPRRAPLLAPLVTPPLTALFNQSAVNRLADPG